MEIKICKGRSCSERHTEYIANRIERDLVFYNIEGVNVTSCLCQWRCKEGPVVLFDNDIQSRMNPVKASELLRKKIEMIKAQKQQKNAL